MPTREDEALTREKLSTMTMAQLRAEAKTRYERAAAIEKKWGDGTVPPEDEAEVKSILSTIDRIEDALAPLEDHEQRKQRIFGNVQRYNERAGRVNHANGTADRDGREWKSPGQQFLDHAQYKALAESAIFNSSQVSYKIDVPLE